MPAYRFYAIGADGTTIMPPTTVECDDHLSAIKEARKLVDGLYVEIWQGARVVTHLVPDSFWAETKV